MKLFQPLDTDYVLGEEWNRKKDGYMLPDTTRESVQRLSPGKKWSEWGGLRLSHDRTHYVLPTGEPLLLSTIRRHMGTMTTPHRLLSSYMAIPNGQVKNFLVACRTVLAVTNHEMIAVVGSKAAEGGGTWHKLFAVWLSIICPTALIHFYDYQEREDTWIYEHERGKILCEWIAEGVTVDALLTYGYTVVIDDVWSPETGVGLQGRDKIHQDSRGIHYSWKGRRDAQDYEPFLHSEETRFFSAPSLNLVKGGCECPVCVQCKKCSRTFDSFLLLREFCSRLGHKAPCFGVSFTADLVELAEKKAELLTTGQMRALPEDARFLTALSEEVVLKQRFDRVRIEEGVPSFEVFQRFRWDQSPMMGKSYPWLEGKYVLFCGVPSSVIGVTKVKRMPGPQSPGLCDAVFLSSLQSWKQQFVANCVYVPENPSVVLREFPDWTFSARKVLNFYEYVKKEEKKEIVQIWSEPHQYHRGTKLIPLPFFPYVDSSLLRVPLRERTQWGVGGELFSLAPKDGHLEVVAFQPMMWRSSLWVREEKWCPVKDCLEFISFPGQMSTSIALPWDMLPQEVEDVEKRWDGGAQKLLRQKWEKKEALGQVFMKGEVKVQSRKLPMQMFQYIREQEEFVLQDGYLVRKVTAHPAFSEGILWDTWRKLRRNYMAYSQIKTLMEVLK